MSEQKGTHTRTRTHLVDHIEEGAEVDALLAGRVLAVIVDIDQRIGLGRGLVQLARLALGEGLLGDILRIVRFCARWLGEYPGRGEGGGGVGKGRGCTAASLQTPSFIFVS